MAKKDIKLGPADRLAILFAYPNIPDDAEPLTATILHWLGATLERDGLNKEMATVSVDGAQYVLHLDGPSDQENQLYETRIQGLLDIGWSACDKVQQIKARKVWSTDGVDRPMWDPNATGNWRFFLTLGVGLVNHRSLQFFHYPPSRLLNPLRDSMKDPVTFRCRDLLVANGVKAEETKFYETRINSTPIAAPDDQGTNDSPPADPVWGGLIPIGYFRKFDADMIRTLIKPHPTVAGCTIPMTAYGNDPRLQFGGMFLDPDKAMIIEVLKGKKTPVLGSNHPFLFYFKAQGGSQPGQRVGSGIMLPGAEAACTRIQQDDLAVVRWQVQMARDPSQDPWRVISAAQAYWKEPGQQQTVSGLVKRHGSLLYADRDGAGLGLQFRFQLRTDGITPEDPSWL